MLENDNPWNIGAVDGHWSVDTFKYSSGLLQISSIVFLKWSTIVLAKDVAQSCGALIELVE